MAREWTFVLPLSGHLHCVDLALLQMVVRIYGLHMDPCWALLGCRVHIGPALEGTAGF
jgi:hypothetical protein